MPKSESSVGRTVLTRLAGISVLGATALGYGALIERNLYILRRFDVPVLAVGSRPIRVLHLSDVHLTADQRRKVDWLHGLASLHPDLVVSTGDHLGGADAIANTLRAHEPLMKFPGVFVWGNNDHFAPVPKSPGRYFKPSRTRKKRGHRIDLAPLADGFERGGWVQLNNAARTMPIAGRKIFFGGLDDPHLKKDRFEKIAGQVDPDADLRIGIMHSPEPRLLNRYGDEGYELLLAGHTHGGQIRLPFYGALVTNCDIDRQRARGPSSWCSPNGFLSQLHVSAGLGTSPYAPIRFCCRPEATLLTLVPTDGRTRGGV
ncbi:MAG: metallophosphoesterase [Antricoccus sp.]